MASVDFIGFVLTVAGCPYTFSTGGLPALSSSSPLWFGGESGVEILDGWLEWPSGWNERAKPLDGDLDQSAVTFKLHDATASAGVAAGFPVLTQLATRDSIHVTSTPLAVNLSASGTSVTVGDGALLGTVPRWVWCEREAMRVTARAGDVLTVTRAALGTKAVAHEIIDGVREPEVFADVPWITRRKAILWGVGDDGVAVPLWIGFATRSPRLSDDGARFDLPCDPLWQVLAQAPVGDPDAVLRVYGYGRNGVSESSTSSPTIARIAVSYAFSPATVYASANGVYRDLESVRERLTQELYDQTTTLLGTRLSHVSIQFVSAAATVTIDHTTLFTGSFQLFGANANLTIVDRGARYTGIATVEGLARSKYLVLNIGTSDFLVSTLAGTPASWAVTTTVDGGFTTHRIPTLRAALSKELWLVVTGVTATDVAPNGPTVSGSTEFLPRKAGVEVPATATLTDSSGFNVCSRVRCDHWLDGLRYGASDLLADASVDDFDWTTASDVRGMTAGLETGRDWLFDGRSTFGAVAIESCQLFGCTPVTRGGRIAFHVWRWPSARTEVDVALSASDVIGSPSWLTWDEGLANRIKVESEDLIIDATDSGSINRYGPGRQLSVKLLGRDTSQLAVDDPVAFSQQILGRMSLWADPLGVVKVKVPLRRINDLELGSVFTLTDWLVPNGTGGRGLTDKLCVVVAREVSIAERGESGVTLDALLFPHVSYDYAPCGRVSSQTAVDTVVLDQSFVQSTAGYSGTDDTTTFAAGDEVELIERDSTTYTSQLLTVASVNVGAHSVTFTTNINGTLSAAITAGTVDLRYSNFAAVQTTQEPWMFVGDDTTRVIDSTDEPARPIAP